MKFLVTDIEFDFNTDMPDYYSVSILLFNKASDTLWTDPTIVR